MAGSVVIQSLCLASTVVQIDKPVSRNQPLAILQPLKFLKRMLKNVKGKMANWVLRAFLEVINHISTKRGCGKTANHTPLGQ